MRRSCVGCGRIDDHPRHIIALRDGSTMDWHMDCHANNGCESCAGQLVNADGLIGDTLRAHITGREAQ